MASIRLTNDTRRLIANRAVEHGFAKREAAIVKEQHALAAKVYDRAYPAKTQKLMETLPKDILRESDTIYFHVGGQYRQVTLAAAKRMGHDRGDLKLAADDKLSEECFDFWRREKELRAERDTARREANAVLRSVTTLEKLLKVWPEVVSFTQDIGVSGQQITALAIPIKDLNVKLGLPPGSK